MEMHLSKQGKMNKHILICGEKGVGKSTLIQRLLDEACLTVGGFCTKMDENTGEGSCTPFIFIPLRCL